MTMFAGRPFLPMLQAAMTGQIPGAILEGYDPRLTAEAVGAPVPASGEFLPPPPNSGTPYLGNAGAPPPSTGRFSGPTVSSPAPPVSSGQGPAYGEGIPQIPDHMSGINASLARNQEIGEKKKKFDFGAFLGSWAGHLGDTLTGNSAYAEHMKHKRRLEELEQEREHKAGQPQQVGSSIIVRDPHSPSGYRTLYRDPSTPEAYALAQGFQPGTDEYAEAVRQYRLGSWSDAAVDNRIGVSGYNFNRRGELQNDRQAHSSGMQEDRQRHSDGQLNRRLTITERGQNIRRSGDTRPKTEAALYADMMDRWRNGANLNGREREFVKKYELRHGGRTPQGRGRRGRDAGSSPVRVNSLDEARRLAPGTVFVTPDGRVKVR